MSFGKRLKAAIKYRNTTQKKLAKILNTTPQSISQYVSGKRNPKENTVSNLANALKLGYDYTKSGEAFFYVNIYDIPKSDYEEAEKFNQEQHRDALNDVIEDMNNIDFLNDPVDVTNYKLNPNTPLKSSKMNLNSLINDNLKKLNNQGLEKIYNYSCDLLEIKKYTKPPVYIQIGDGGTVINSNKKVTKNNSDVSNVNSEEN